MPPRGKPAKTSKLDAPENLGGDPSQTVLQTVIKQFGAGSIIRMGDQPIEKIPTIPSGSVGLDTALGIGGYPRGRVIEIFGPFGTGKTTLALHAIANVQKAGGLAVMIDAEHALDPSYADNLGVDVEALLLSQPDYGEQGLEIADMVIRSRQVDIVVIDSVAALVPKAELEGEMGAVHVGLQARMMSQALRKLTGAIGSTKTTCIFINQLREKVGVLYGSPETTSGGKALPFYASVRLDCRKTETIKDGTDLIGHKLRIKVVKNKLAPPFKEYTADIIWGKGLSHEGELVTLGTSHGIIHKGGAWYAYEGVQIGQGEAKARAYLEQHPDMADEIEAKLRQVMYAQGKATASQASKLVITPDDLIGPGGFGDLAVSTPPGGNDPDTQ